MLGEHLRFLYTGQEIRGILAKRLERERAECERYIAAVEDASPIRGRGAVLTQTPEQIREALAERVEYIRDLADHVLNGSYSLTAGMVAWLWGDKQFPIPTE